MRWRQSTGHGIGGARLAARLQLSLQAGHFAFEALVRLDTKLPRVAHKRLRGLVQSLPVRLVPVARLRRFADQLRERASNRLASDDTCRAAVVSPHARGDVRI